MVNEYLGIKSLRPKNINIISIFSNNTLHPSALKNKLYGSKHRL